VFHAKTYSSGIAECAELDAQRQYMLRCLNCEALECCGLMPSMKTNILIVGGGVGGCAAALAASQVAAEAGLQVILTEESDWLGGQLTAQAVPPDEHGWIERFGCTASYRRFRAGVRDYYRRNYPLSASARMMKYLNPGNGWVSPLCHEPRVALAVLEELLA